MAGRSGLHKYHIETSVAMVRLYEIWAGSLMVRFVR